MWARGRRVRPAVEGEATPSAASPWVGAAALRRVQEMLGTYEPPPMDEAVDEALREYIAKREGELPEGLE